MICAKCGYKKYSSLGWGKKLLHQKNNIWKAQSYKFKQIANENWISFHVWQETDISAYVESDKQIALDGSLSGYSLYVFVQHHVLLKYNIEN